MSWLLLPFGAIGLTIVAMILTSFVTLPVSVAVSAGVRAYARHRPVPDDRRARRRYLTGCVVGVMAVSAWMIAFERPGQPGAPIVIPAVVLLGVLALGQALCCVGLLRHVPSGQPAWVILATLLLWGGMGVAALAYEAHRGGMIGAL